MYETLRNTRKASGKTVKGICELLGLKTEAAYFKKETGATKFTVDEAIKLASLFHTTVEKLFSECVS